jgi:hypothetical protein
MAVQCPLQQSLLLSYDESTPMTKHGVGLLEERVILPLIVGTFQSGC